MYGRESAGHSSTTSTHQPALTSIATPASSRSRIRGHQPTGAASSHTAVSAGSTRKAWSILARKPTPTSTPASTSHRVPPFSTARCVAYAAPISTSTSRASGLLNRKIRTATGVRASAAPAISPAPGPATRLTAAYSSPTDATPMSACGTRTLQLLSPKIRTESPVTHSAAGVLSTVIAFAASDEPKNHAFQLSPPACAAAE